MAASKSKELFQKKLHLAGLHTNATKAFQSLLKQAWSSHGELRILVTGKTGQGKSTLINGILGDEVVVEGARASRCTTEVEMFTKTTHGVPVKVFDSPGLQDRTANEEEYIQGMKAKCGELSLVLYCTKMINTRLTDDDKHAMRKLTKAFGEKFWEYAVFVLTFANMENCNRKDDRDEDVSEPAFNDDEGWKKLTKQRFEGRLKIWTDGLKEFLITEVGVSPDITNRIPVVPTGDHKKSRMNPDPYNLPDRDDWFNKLWEVCCLRVKETQLFLEINKDRMVDETSGIEGDDDRVGDKQNEDNQDLPMSKEDAKEAIERYQQAKKNFMELEKEQKYRDGTGACTHSGSAQHKEERGIAKGTVQDIKNKISIPSDALLPSAVHSSVKSRPIYITDEFAKEVAVESVRRGFGESVADACRAAFDNIIAKPAKWLMRHFK